MPQVRIVSHNAFAHHGAHSGYVQLLGHLVSDGRTVVHGLGPESTRRHRWAGVAFRLRESLPSSATTLHLYPEQTLGWPPRGGRTVAALHQPGGFYDQLQRPGERAFLKALPHLDAAIALGPDQAEWAAERIGTVHLVPHGVDADHFSPGEKQPLALSVHGWLRDPGVQVRWEEALSAAGYTITRIGRGNPRLTDEQYRAQLQRASVVLVCAPDGVASNALVEGMAAGAVVLGDLSRDCRWYLSDENADLLAAAAGGPVLPSATELATIGSANRAKVESDLAWAHPADEIRRLLRPL